MKCVYEVLKWDQTGFWNKTKINILKTHTAPNTNIHHLSLISEPEQTQHNPGMMP